MENSDQGGAFDVFRDALELPPKERAAYVEAAGLDAEQRALVESLLKADAANEDQSAEPGSEFDALIKGVVAHTRDLGDVGLAGQTIGKYSLQSELGRGGMGVVYLALQGGTNRLVALKCLKSAFSSKNLVKRFEQEIEILGRLDHPGIAKVFDAGTREVDGSEVHFFAMEYVRGRNLVEYLREGQVELRDKLALVASICSAVDHAHSQGVVHRDLKPANILVTEDGQAKVLDFGISRFVDSDVQLTTIDADGGRLIGTLSYMSPEQAGGDQREVGPASDIYALGVLAFESICGVLPHDIEERTLLSAARIIRDIPARSLRGIDADLPIDVETIIGKALDPEPERRYASAQAMADDLHRFLQHEPIHARPPSTLYVVVKFARRHRLVVAGSMLLALTLLLASIFSMGWALQAEEARRGSEWSNYRMSLDLAESDLREGSLASAQECLEAVPTDRRGIEWRYLSRRADQSTLTFGNHWLLVWSVAFSPDGARGYSGSGDGTLCAWDTSSGELLTSTNDHDERVFSVAASPDGSLIASGSIDVRLRDAKSLETQAIIHGHGGAIHGLAFSPDGNLLASGDGKGGLLLSDGRDGHLLHELAGCEHGVWEFGFLSGSARMLSSCHAGELRMWDTATGEELLRVDPGAGGIYALDVAPGGEHVAIGSHDGSLKLLDPTTLDVLLEATAHSDSIYDLVYSSDGTRIITSSKDRTIIVWDAITLEPRTRLVGHADAVSTLAFDPHTKRLLSGSWDQSLRLWDPEVLESHALGYPLPDVIEFSWVPGQDAFSTCSPSGQVASYDISTGAARGRASQISLPAGLPSKRSGDEPVPAHWRYHRADNYGAPLRNGQEYWQRVSDNTLHFFDTDTGSELRVLSNSVSETFAVAVHPGKGWIATGGGDPYEVELWSLKTMDKIAQLPRHANDIEDLEFSPSGRWLVSGSEDASARVWRTDTWEPVAVLDGHGGGNVRVAFHPDEQRLATVSDEGSVRFWAVGSWDEVLSVRLPAGAGEARRIAFSPSGDQLFVLMQNGLHVLDCR